MESVFRNEDAKNLQIENENLKYDLMKYREKYRQIQTELEEERSNNKYLLQNIEELKHHFKV